MVRALSILALVLLSFGCVHEKRRPVLEIHSMRAMSMSPQGLGLMLRMRVNNHHPFDVKVRNVRANVVIANAYQLPPVYADPDAWLAANRYTFVDVPVLLPWPMLRPLLMTTAQSPVIHYQVTGYADVTAVRLLGIQRNDHYLNQQGSVSRGELMSAAGRSLPFQ